MTNFYNWQQANKLDMQRFRKESPNLRVIKDHVMKRWQGTNLGTYGVRPIKGGGSPSSHSFGVAWDYRAPNRKKTLEVIKFLIANSEELGIQAVHDYRGCRIWRSFRAGGKRGWVKQKPDKHGMGQAWGTWIHIEITKDSWKDKRPVEVRLPDVS